eukprot:6577436-Alexandrium_andersonii.AAC.1
MLRTGSEQAAVRVDDRVGHAAEDVPDSAAVHIAWVSEAKSKVGEAWVSAICHQLRVLGGRWGTLLEADLAS